MDLQAIDPRLEAGVLDVLGVDRSVGGRRSFGGTAPERVLEAVAAAEALALTPFAVVRPSG